MQSTRPPVACSLACPTLQHFQSGTTVGWQLCPVADEERPRGIFSPGCDGTCGDKEHARQQSGCSMPGYRECRASICLPACPPACLSACPPACPPACLSACLPACLPMGYPWFTVETDERVLRADNERLLRADDERAAHRRGARAARWLRADGGRGRLVRLPSGASMWWRGRQYAAPRRI
jgi:hypothetical protein